MKNKSYTKHSKCELTTVNELNFVKRWLDTHVLSIDDLRFKTDLKFDLKPVPNYDYCLPCFEFYFNVLEFGKCFDSIYFDKPDDALLSHNFGDNVVVVKRGGTYSHSLYFFYKDGSSTYNIYKQHLTICGFEGELEVLCFFNKIAKVRWIYYDKLITGGYYFLSIKGDEISNCLIENQIANLLRKDKDWSYFLKRIVDHYEISQFVKQHILYARRVLKKRGKK